MSSAVFVSVQPKSLLLGCVRIFYYTPQHRRLSVETFGLVSITCASEVRFLGICEPMKGFCTLSRLNRDPVVYPLRLFRY